jgi:hypothetical protein
MNVLLAGQKILGVFFYIYPFKSEYFPFFPVRNFL